MRGADRHRLPEQLTSSVELELARMGSPSSSAALTAMLAVWESAVGESIARNAWPARAGRDGTVVVHVSSSAWAHELTQLEEVMKERLGEAAPERLKFVVGPVPEPGAADTKSSAGQGATPSAEDEDRAAALTRAIDDQDLRETVKKAAALSLAASRAARPDRPL